jgi:hypothetical protein
MVCSFHTEGNDLRLRGLNPINPECTPMAGLGPATHAYGVNCGRARTWMPGSGPGKGLLGGQIRDAIYRVGGGGG